REPVRRGDGPACVPAARSRALAVHGVRSSEAARPIRAHGGGHEHRGTWVEGALIMADVPVIAATDARIAIDGVVAIDRLTLATRGDRVARAGDPAALTAAITGSPPSPDADDELPGEAYVIAGSLLVAGRDVAVGAHTAVIGAALLDPPLPPSWSA